MRGVAAALAAVALALPAGAAGSTAFTPTDPLAGRQWYLTPIHAFDFWTDLPVTLAPVRVAVVDSGLDVDRSEERRVGKECRL